MSLVDPKMESVWQMALLKNMLSWLLYMENAVNPFLIGCWKYSKQ